MTEWRLCCGGALGGVGKVALGCFVDSDYAGCLDAYTLICGLVITFRGEVDWRSRIQRSTAQTTTDPEYYAFGLGCMRLTQCLHSLNELGIQTLTHMFSDSQSQITSIKSRIHCRPAVAHIATKYYLAADMARDGEMELSYIQTTEMLADRFTKPVLTNAFLKQFASLGIIGVDLVNGLGIAVDNGLGNGLRMH